MTSTYFNNCTSMCFAPARTTTIQLFVATEVEEEPEEEAEGDFEEDLIHAPDDCEACYGGGVAWWMNISTRYTHD